MLDFATRFWEFLVRRIDPALFGIVMALTAVGFVTLFSAADQSAARLGNQLASLAVALAAMWLVANIPPQTLARVAVPLYVAALALLIGVALFGVVVNGSRRWLNLGVTRIQPSELMKVALPLMLAWYFQKFEGRLGWKDFVFAALLIAIPAILVKRQPDLGTALLLIASGFFVLYLAGLSWKIIVGLAAVAGALAPVFWNLLHDYQRRRILTFLDPTQDPSDREPYTCYLGDPRIVNDGPVGLARFTTARSWLSQWSHSASNANGLTNGARISVPSLVLNNTADLACTPSHAQRLFAALGSSDKTYRDVVGADHYYTSRPDLLPEAVGVVRGWMAERDL